MEVQKRTVHRVFFVLVLAMVAAFCSAGFYHVEISGGTQTERDAQGNSYTVSPASGPGPDTAYYRLFSSSSYPIFTYSESSGPLTATFTWVGDTPDEPSPTNVVVRETISAEASSGGTNTATTGVTGEQGGSSGDRTDKYESSRATQWGAATRSASPARPMPLP